MQYITDLEIHSKYARACSPNSDLEHHASWADKKGIDIVGTGDFTHPVWFAELKQKLEEESSGVYKLKNSNYQARFLLSAEVSCIYRKNNATRRIHVLLFAPNLQTVKKLNDKLAALGGKLSSDGRPILGLDIKRLLELALETDEKILFIPAHIFTPWFGFYGSKSGFDSLTEAFEELTPYVLGVETGLSSDPSMNWRLKELDDKAIVSWSDAHSPANLGREATVFELEKLSYENIYDAIKNGYRQSPKTMKLVQGDIKNKISYTIEFFPEEGKYHYDGHRDCDISFNPQETQKHKGLCPKCKKPLTVGVLYRVQELADHAEGFQDKTRPPFKSLVPLQEVIAESYSIGKASKKVQAEYDRLIETGNKEFGILLELPEEQLVKIMEPLIVSAIMRMRRGNLHVVPGYDGVFGKIEIFTKADRQKIEPAKLF